MNIRDNWPLFVSIGGMLLGITGTIVSQGTLLQKSLFLSAGSILLIGAYAANQKTLTILQLIVMIGSLLAFFKMPFYLRASLLLGSALIAIIYLTVKHHIEYDRFWPIGGIGITILAAGFAVSGAAPFYSNTFIAAGALVLALYSGLKVVLDGIPIQTVWVVLNIAFMINPIRRALMLL